jgi:hypothetical protein
VNREQAGSLDASRRQPAQFVDTVREIADAVLYEGYLLYPYRASAVKNHSRWQFGVVMPVEYTRIDPSERAYTQAEFVVEATEATAFTVALRFLHLQSRSVQRWSGGQYVPCDTIEVDGTSLTAWEEAVEHELVFGVPELPHEYAFHVEAVESAEAVRDRAGTLVGRVVRRRDPLRGTVSVTARPVPGPWRALSLRVRVHNHTPAPDARDRSAALRSAFIASHTIVGVDGGTHLSMVDPPEWAAGAVAQCVNIGSWPVLVGQPWQRDLMLCAPIILYDHPQIAPESPGDLFDGTEIDELLTLRTLTLSDAEKREARATDARAAAVIDRVEALAPAQLARMHGAMRELRPVHHGPPVGSRVRLRPGVRRTDAQDMFLVGRIAVVEAVLHDLDDNLYLAVTLADDPAADLQRDHGRFWYFAPDEVEPCND